MPTDRMDARVSRAKPMQRCARFSAIAGVALLASVAINFGGGSVKANTPELDLSLSRETAVKVGRQVWRNETGGSRDAITSWNAAENFASVGIGHFIWFPEDVSPPFQESFPTLLQYLRANGATPPAWLDTDVTPPCPWTSREDFKRNFNSDKMTGLRKFLLATVGLQTSYLAQRMQAALPKMLATLPEPAVQDHVRQQFHRVAAASPDLYPLVDYVNFKGEGINPAETSLDRDTGKAEGWGLKHVLLQMTGTSTDRTVVLNAFSEAAANVLLRRIKNNPPSARWQKGWIKRTDTYRQPL